MTRRALWLLLVLGCVSCRTPDAGAVPDDLRAFCELTLDIDEIHAAADDKPLTPEAERLVDEKVAELRPLIPADYVDDYRRRYWPITSVTGLDTGGVATQRSYDRMASLADECI